MTRVIFEGVSFFVCVAAILSLLWLPGCGQEAPEVVAAHEHCTVTLNTDGTVECRCEVVR